MSRQHKKTRVRRSALPAILLTAVVIGIVLIVLLTRGGDNWSKKERISINQQMHSYVLQECDEWDDMTTVAITETVHRDKEKGWVTYDVSVYRVAEDAALTEELWQLKKDAADRHGALAIVGVATVTLDAETGVIINFQNEPAGQ